MAVLTIQLIQEILKIICHNKDIDFFFKNIDKECYGLQTINSLLAKLWQFCIVKLQS